MNFGEDNMNYMPEDPYNTSGRGPYSSMNGGMEARHNDINAMHSSHVSLQSNGSNRNRIIKGSHSSLPQDQHNDNYAPYSGLPRNYENLGRSPSHESPRSPGTPTRLHPHYDGYEDNYRSSPQMIYDRNSPNPLRYGGQDSLDNSIQQLQLETSSNHFEPSVRVPPDDRYGGPPPEDSFYRQSPMIEDRYGSQDNRLHGNQEPVPQDNYMSAPNDGYQDNRGNDDSFRGQHPDDSFQGQPDSFQGQPDSYSGAPPPLVDRYGQPLDESYQDAAPTDQVPHPRDRYGEPLDDSYRGQQEESFRGQPPQGDRYQDNNEDGYRGGPPPDDLYNDQPPSGNFTGDPHDGSLRGDQYDDNRPPDDRYKDYVEDPYGQQDRKHEGLPEVQDDPFADDPFRQKQRSLLQLRDEDPYPRGPSPGAGSDRMGPASYVERPPPQYDHMDGQPPYEQGSRQQVYPDDVPQQYYDQDTLPSQAKLGHAAHGDYATDGRRTPSIQGGTMRWRSPDLQEVIDYLNSPSDVIKANSAAYLTHLCYMDDGAKAKIRGLDGIPLLVDLLNSEIPEVHKNACGALKNLSYGRNNDDNKRAVKNAGGIPTLVRLLRKTQSDDVKDSVTGVLWNLSSCEDLKKPIIDDCLAVLVNVVIIPYSGWEKRSTSPYQANEPWTTVFRNATGMLRNVSSAGAEARKKLRECHGLVDSLLHTLRTSIEQNNCDNKPVENCVCTLRNLAFRIQEVEDPDFYKKRNATLQKQKQQEKKGEKVGCFGIMKQKSGQKSKGPNAELIANPRLPPTAGEYSSLWGLEAMRCYLKLLTGLNPVTLEGACGAIQNLSACDWKPALEVRALVRKEKGLPSLVDLLTYEVESVVGAAAVALRNLSIDERNKELVGKYAMKQLISNLPQENRSKEMMDSTICAVLACLIEVIKHNLDFARAFHQEEGIPRLMFLTKNRHRYSHLAVKYTLAVLKALWKFKYLHASYQQLGYTEKDFNPPPLSDGEPGSNFSTMNRPTQGQGYDDTTLSTRTENRAAYPNSHNQTSGNPLIQGHSNPALARDQQDHMMYGSKGHMNDIPLQDMGPGYSPIDEQRNQRNKPPVGGVPLLPYLPPDQQMMPPPGNSPSQEPLYARVNKKRRDEMAEGQGGHGSIPLDGGQEGADSWV